MVAQILTLKQKATRAFPGSSRFFLMILGAQGGT